MTIPQASMGLVLRVAVAGAWAGLLVLVGLWLVLDWAVRAPGFAIPCRLGGVTLIAMGQFVFAALVADRLFPGVWPGVRLAVEGASALTFLIGIATLGVLAWGALT